MKKTAFFLILILLIETLSFTALAQTPKTVLFALESEYAYNGKEVLNINAAAFMYKKQSYVPVRFVVESFGGKITEVKEGEYLTLNYKGKEHTLSFETAKVYNSITYFPAKELSGLLNVNILWNDGVVGFSDTETEIDDTKTEDFKFMLGFVTYIDRYNYETALYKNTVIFRENSSYAVVNGSAVKLSDAPYMKDGKLFVPLNFTASNMGAEVSVLDSDKNYSIKFNYKNYYFSKDYIEYKNGVPYAPLSDIAKEMRILWGASDGFFVISGILKDYSKEEKADILSLLESGALNLNDDEVVFSVSSGLYTKEFELSLSSHRENAKIVYTLDGSEPTEKSKVYNGKIKIYDRTADKNDLSSDKSIVENGYIPPKDNVFKGTVVKARILNDNNTLGKTVQATYLVNKNIHSKYMGIKIVSLSTNKENLLGENGIYKYPNYLTVGNPNEVSGYMELFDKNGHSVLSQSVGIRLNGAGTRALPQKSFRIYARENENYSNGTSKTLKYDFFDGDAKDVYGNSITEFKRIILRNAGDDWSKYFLRDTLAQSLAQPLGLDMQSYSPTAVLLNGEFWGIYLIRERYDNNYFKYHYNLSDNKDVAMIEIANDPLKATLQEGDEQDLKRFNEQSEFIINNDMSVEDNYKRAEEYFDLDNFINIYVANIFLENVDWPHNNIKLWQNKNPENKHMDSKWRFVLTDMDVTMESLKTIYEDAYLKGDERRAYWEKGRGGSLEQKLNAECISNFMFNSLLKNENFKNKFIARYFYAIDTVFAPEKTVPEIEKRYNETYHLRNEQTVRYIGSWQYTNVKELIKWAKERPETSKQEIVNLFNLSEKEQDITVTIKCPEIQGTVYLCGEKSQNGKEISVKTKKNYPVYFKAEPKDGYVFKYFSVDGVFWHKNSYTTRPGGNMNITAVFEKITPN